MSNEPLKPEQDKPEQDPEAEARAQEEVRMAAEIAAHNTEVRARMSRRTRRSFLAAGGAAVAGAAGFGWLMSRREEDGVPWPIRRVLAINEGFWRDYYSTAHTAPDFTGKAPLEDHVNSDIGITDALDAQAWRLRLYGLKDQEDGYELTIADLRTMPRTTMTTEFKCVEGWSAIMQWSGVRFSDFMAAHAPAEPENDRVNGNLPAYASLETPDHSYYVGMEMESLLHPQTLLAYEINGSPLTEEHGAPLRLVTPLKYGLKQIKRIGSIRYQISRPADYWYERGYDWYVGL